MRKLDYITNPSDGVAIPCISNIVDSDDLYILVHGFGSNKNSGGILSNFKNYLDLDSQSWVAFDLRGHGDSKGSFSLDRSISDLLVVGNYFYELTKKNLIVIGHSFGGSTSAFSFITKAAVPTIKDHLKAVCLLSASDDFFRAYQLGKLVKACHWFFDETIISSIDIIEDIKFKFGRIKIKIRDLKWFLEEATILRASDGLTESNCPIILFHGTYDPVVPFGEVVEFYTKANTTRAVYAIDGCDHTYYGWETDVYKIIRKLVNSNQTIDGFHIVPRKSLNWLKKFDIETANDYSCRSDANNLFEKINLITKESN